MKTVYVLQMETSESSKGEATRGVLGVYADREKAETERQRLIAESHLNGNQVWGDEPGDEDDEDFDECNWDEDYTIDEWKVQ